MVAGHQHTLRKGRGLPHQFQTFLAGSSSRWHQLPGQCWAGPGEGTGEVERETCGDTVVGGTAQGDLCHSKEKSKSGSWASPDRGEPT